MRTPTEYLRLLQSLLPWGKAWPRDDEAVLTQTLLGKAGELSRVDSRQEDLYRERDTRQALELLGDFETELGLPDDCSALGETITERRQMAHLKYVALGQQYKEYFIELAASLGYEITIEEFTPFWSGVGAAGDSCGDQEVIFYWQVTIDISNMPYIFFKAGASSSGDPLIRIPSVAGLECVLNKYKPAHTTLIIAYSGPSFDSGFSSGFYAFPSEDPNYLYGGFDGNGFDIGFATYKKLDFEEVPTFTIGSDPLDSFPTWAAFRAVTHESDGDIVSFRRGEEYFVELLAVSSGVTYTAHGVGADPVINSSVLISPGDWSKTGGRVNVYEAPLPAIGNIDQVAGTAFFTVYEDLQWTALVADVATVDATPGSCFYDTVGDVLYVHTFASDNPGTNGHEFHATAYLTGICTNGYDNIAAKHFEVRYPASQGVFTANYDSPLPYPVSSHIVIEDVLVWPAKHNAMGLLGQDILVDSCEVRHITGDGGFAIGDLGVYQSKPTDGVTLRDCTYGSNTLWGGKTSIAVHLEYGVSNVTIENFTIDGEVTHGIAHPVIPKVNGLTITGVNVTAAANITGAIVTLTEVDDLEISGVINAGPIVFGIWAAAGVNSNIYDNLITGGGYGILIGAITGISRVHHNLLVSQTTAGVSASDGAVHQVDNNTFYLCTQGLYFDVVPSSSPTTYGRNNIFRDCVENIIAGGVTLTLDYNVGFGHTSWGPGGLTLAVYQSLGLDLNSFEANPLMEDPAAGDFTLRVGSPCIDTGTDVGLIYDYQGTLIPQGAGTDIGAYEKI